MSESKQRQFHTLGLKVKVGLEAIRGTKTINEISLEFGVHPAQVSQWKKEIQEHAKTLFEVKRGPKPVAVQVLVARGTLPRGYLGFLNRSIATKLWL